MCRRGPLDRLIKAEKVSLHGHRTSPKAPRPMTLRDSKSSRPSRVRFRRRNSVSLRACCERRMTFCQAHKHTNYYFFPAETHWRASEAGRQATRYLLVGQTLLVHGLLQLLLPVDTQRRSNFQSFFFFPLDKCENMPCERGAVEEHRSGNVSRMGLM